MQSIHYAFAPLKTRTMRAELSAPANSQVAVREEKLEQHQNDQVTGRQAGEIICAWSGFFAMVFFIIAWVVFYGWLAPPSPSLDPEQVAEIYKNNRFGILTGNVIMTNFAAPLTIPFAAIITVYMFRMRGVSPVLGWTQLASSSVNALIFIVPSAIYGAMAFRTDRPAELIALGHDIAWLNFDFVVGPTQVQWMALALAVLMDRSEKPILPRWFGYYCVWSAIMIFANNAIGYFPDGGPFSWNGVLGWYLGAGTFCLWYFVAFYVIRKAVVGGYR